MNKSSEILNLNPKTEPVMAELTPTYATSTRTSIYTTVLAAGIVSVVLTGCGGGGDSTPSPLADAQGRWVSPTCVVDEDQSLQEEITVSGSTGIQTQVRYTSSTTCEGTLTINTNVSTTITVTGETTTVDEGEAKQIDLNFTRGYITASEAVLSVLESQGTTLQDSFTAQGIADINNVPLSDLVDAEQLFTIYKVTGNELRIGGAFAFNDGSSAETRHTVLGSETYIKQ